MRFIFTFGIGILATLAWQTYGDTAREMIAGSYPQLIWLSPRAAAAQPVVTTTSAPARPTDAQQMQELSIRLADMRQRVDQLSQQLASSQEQVTRDIGAKLAAAERDILDKIAAAQPRTEATVRKPATPPQATQSTQLR
jgi:hypothetical protein